MFSSVNAITKRAIILDNTGTSQIYWLTGGNRRNERAINNMRIQFRALEKVASTE